MDQVTPTLELPLLVAGQGQKDITHNEALLALDFLVGARVQSRQLAIAPEDAQAGEAWLVASGGAGEWAGEDGRLACWTAGGWRFLSLPEGFQLWVGDEQRAIRNTRNGFVLVGGSGIPEAALSAPSGGAVVDAEAREVLAGLLQRLVDAGLLRA